MADLHRQDMRQRRIVAPSHSYQNESTRDEDLEHPSSPQSSASYSPFPSFTSRWTHTRTNASIPLQLLMRTVELLATAVAMLVVPNLIHRLVRCLDDMYELVGRRARSRYEVLDGKKVAAGALLLVAWHAVLVLLSWKMSFERVEDKGEVIGEQDGGRRGREKTRGGTWTGVFHRLLLPSYLVLALIFWLFRLSSHSLWPTFTASAPLHSNQT